MTYLYAMCLVIWSFFGLVLLAIAADRLSAPFAWAGVGVFIALAVLTQVLP